MRSSEIVDPRRRPANPLSGYVYMPKDKDVLAAMQRAGANLGVALSLSSSDTTLYEFPGDATYARYLRGQ